MKQQLRTGIVLNLLLVLGNFNDLAYGTEHQIESDLPATTIKEWQAQINNYVTAQ